VGIMVLIEQHGSFTVEAPKFPSPCGDYGSYRHLLWHERIWWIYGFRPLAGIMVLIKIRERHKEKHSAKVSVPLRGLWFLSNP
jgi:hypothetical protein